MAANYRNDEFLQRRPAVGELVASRSGHAVCARRDGDIVIAVNPGHVTERIFAEIRNTLGGFGEVVAGLPVDAYFGHLLLVLVLELYIIEQESVVGSDEHIGYIE